MTRQGRYGIAILLLTALATSVAPAADRSGAARIMLVVDGSGSMWAQLDGRAKIEIARDVIRDVVAEWDPRLDVGLIAYGHRDRHDCDDIETLVPVAPMKAEAVLAAARTIVPNGMTPIGASLQRAADSLAYRERVATVVLISDGKETCDVDPCTVARLLEESGLDFKAHVIGFDVSSVERAQLECIADVTGGLFIAADDTAGLLAALRAAVREVAQRGDAQLWLSATLAAGTPEIAEPIHWLIRPLDPATGEAGAAVVDTRAASLTPALPVGRYRVQATYEGLAAQLDVDYALGQRSRHVLDLSAGQIELVAIDRTGAPIETGITWRVKASGDSADPAAVPLREAERSPHRFTLPAGRYQVEGEHDGSTVTRDILLSPGRSLREEVQFGIGRLALRAVLGQGQSPISQPLHWRVQRAAKRGGKPGETVVDESRATVLETLDTGHYLVTAVHGEATSETWVEVRSAVTSPYTVDLAAGSLRVFGSLPPPGGAIHDAVDWQIQPLDHSRGRTIERRGASHDLVLPAGAWRVSGRHGDLRGSATVVVRPGETASVNVTLAGPAPAGRAR